jgi:hypothetical protein
MSRRARKPNQSKLRFEALEKRMLLSATDFVTVKLDHGSLIIRGTEVANAIIVTEAAGVFTVTGLGTTTINGAVNTIQNFLGVTKDVKIDLRGGNDAVLVSGDPGGVPGALPAPSNMLIPRDLKIETGAGNDTVAVDTVVVGHDASINTGSGTDSAAVWLSTIGRDLEVKMGNGGENLGVGGTVVGRNVELKTGSGADEVDIFGLIGFNSGAFNRLKVDTNGGNDLVTATLNPADLPLTAFSALQLPPADLAAALADIASLAKVSVFAREAKFETESGVDDVLLKNLAISKELNVELGSGNDTLTFDGTTNIYAKATLDGGGGVDTFFGTIVNPKTKFKHFELINPV